MPETLALPTQLALENGATLARLLEPDLLARIVVQILLFCASALFSSSEVALFSLSKADLHRLRRERHPQIARLYALLEQPRRLIISILCGNELVNVAAAANMAAILIALFDEVQAGLINLVIMVPLLLLLGEVTPKSIAISNPVGVATRLIAGPMTLWVHVVAPFRWLVRLLADHLTTLLVGEEKSPENLLMADEIRTLVRELQESGELRLEERELVDALLEASTTEVVEIMTPRTRIDFIGIDVDVAEALERVRAQRQRRIPVYRAHRDNLVGFLHAEDLMALVLDNVDPSTVSLADLLHPVVVVPPTKKLDETLEFFRDHDVQAAVVLSEFGGVEGLVTVQDALAFIFDPLSAVGVSPDRYAGPTPGTFDVPGAMKLTSFDDLTNFGITDPRMTTVGGVVFRHLDRLPAVGDTVTFDGITFEVLDMAGHRIARVRAGRAGAET